METKLLKTKDVKKDNNTNEAGFYCEVCDCIVKDSLNYLDHVNGKRHNRNLGISLKKFTDSTLEEVKEMLEFKKREREEQESGFNYGLVDEEKMRRLKREKKKRQKARRAGLEPAHVDEDNRLEEGEDDDEDDQKEEEDKDDGDEEATMEDMAEIMGFGSFSSSKK